MKKISVALLLVLFALVIVWFSMANRGPAAIPVNLLGKWVADAVGYEDRYLNFQDENLIIGTGGSNCDIYFIRRVTQDVKGSSTHYKIEYENFQETRFKLKFVYEKGNRESLKIDHMDNIIWLKEG